MVLESASLSTRTPSLSKITRSYCTHVRYRGPERRKASAPVLGTGADALSKIVRRCPTLPQGPPCSTIGAERLSFRVRNVTGRFPHAMTTETLSGRPPRAGHRQSPSEQAHFSVECSSVLRYDCSQPGNQT